MLKIFAAVMGFFALAVVEGQSISGANYDYIGGIPMRTPDECPSGTSNGQTTFQQNCCGVNQTFVKIESSVCCESETDCYDQVLAAPKCADPSWQLCGTSGGGFCCQEDWVCYTQSASGSNGGGVGCSSPGATVRSGQSVVSTVFLAHEGPNAATTTSSSSTESSASTSSLLSASPLSSVATQPTTTTLSTNSSNIAPGLQTTTSPTASSTSATTSTTSTTLTTLTTSNGPAVGKNDSVLATKKGGISNGAKISIGVVAGILIICGAFTGGIWFAKKRLRQKSVTQSGAQMPEKSNYQFDPRSPADSELGGTPATFEMHAEQKPIEMGNGLVPEMDSGEDALRRYTIPIAMAPEHLVKESPVLPKTT